MFGIIVKGLIMGVMIVLAIPLLSFAILVAGTCTLYTGIKYHDWWEGEWEHFFTDLKELWDQAIDIVLDR